MERDSPVARISGCKRRAMAFALKFLSSRVHNSLVAWEGVGTDVVSGFVSAVSRCCRGWGTHEIIIDQCSVVGGYREQYNNPQRRLMVSMSHPCQSMCWLWSGGLWSWLGITCQALLPAGMRPWPLHLPPTSRPLLRSNTPPEYLQGQGHDQWVPHLSHVLRREPCSQVFARYIEHPNTRLAPTSAPTQSTKIVSASLVIIASRFSFVISRFNQTTRVGAQQDHSQLYVHDNR